MQDTTLAGESHNRVAAIVRPTGRRNWSCCTRFSNSVARFYAVPVPNEDPLAYFKVPSTPR